MSDSGERGTASSWASVVSRTGRFVAFSSGAPNLVQGDTNQLVDLFVRDTRTGRTERVSLSKRNRQGFAFANVGGFDLSDSGRSVVFQSASQLVPRDRNRQPDIYLRDRLDGTTAAVSLGIRGHRRSSEAYYPRISGDGSRVCFTMYSSDGGESAESGLRLLVRGQRTRVPRLVAPPDSWECAISRTGRFIAFVTDNRLTETDLDALPDIYVRDLLTGRFDLVSVPTYPVSFDVDAYNAAISADGRYVAFDSDDRLAGDDRDDDSDVYVRDRYAGTTKRVSVADGGADHFGSWSSSISDDGRYVVFTSQSTLVPEDDGVMDDVYLRDVKMATTVGLSTDMFPLRGRAGCYRATIAPLGHVAAFSCRPARGRVLDPPAQVFLRRFF